MRRKVLCLVVLISLIGLTSWLPQPADAALGKICGVWYQDHGRWVYPPESAASDIPTLVKAYRPNTILVPINVYQATRSATDPHRDSRTALDNNIASLVRLIHQNRADVALLITLLVDDGAWSGIMTPTDPVAWFANWRENVLRPYALLAEREKVEYLVIGAELMQLEDAKFSGEWRASVDLVRRLYKGSVSYSTNWWFDRRGFARALLGIPWDVFDIIGVVGYFELTAGAPNPKLSQVSAAWSRDLHAQNVLADLEMLSDTYSRIFRTKPVVFWEIGYRSVDRTLERPWDFTLAGPSDFDEQTLGIEAFRKAFQLKRWFGGWTLFSESVGLPTSATGYDTLKKPALSEAKCR